MMAAVEDDATDADSVPDNLFQRSSSADEVQDAQHPSEDGGAVSQQYRQRLPNDSEDEPGDPQGASLELYSDDESDRENRFDGPASTWRFYTESERALAASLDQERANDLSIHLYNAHALKARLRDPEMFLQAKHHHGKNRWIQINEDGTAAWQPDGPWTAWPMRPDDVPRRGEEFGLTVSSTEDEKAAHRMALSWRPSADLQDEIQASMLRMAKKQLRGRQNQHDAQHRLISARVPKDSSPRKRKRSSSMSSHTPSQSHDEAEPGILPRARHDDQSQGAHQNFEILVDDDNATEILQPHTRQILSKLDDLLLGLHKNRQGHVKQAASSRSRSRSQRSRSRTREKPQPATDNEDEADRANDVNSSNELNSRFRSASQTQSPAIDPVNLDDETADARKAAEHARKSKRKPKLNPRDWSEVLGIASLVGWNPEVVRRARDRCASLFGEDLTFRTLGEQQENEHAVPESESRGFVVEEEQEVVGYSCPVEACARFREPWPLKKTWRWREHLKRSHGYTKIQIEGLERELKGGGDGQAAADAGTEGKTGNEDGMS